MGSVRSLRRKLGVSVSDLFRVGGGGDGHARMSRLDFSATNRLYGLNLARVLIGSALGGWRDRTLFRHVRCFCLFIGYARSGTSLVGSLLDAHENAIIAHELDVLRFVRPGLTRAQLFSLLCSNSRTFTAAGREWAGYSYRIADQWQGQADVLKVIGDKTAGVTTRRLAAQPDLLDRLSAKVGVRVKLIHVIRNPFDMIATRHRHRPDRSLDLLAARVFALVQAVSQLRTRLGPEVVFDLYHEELIADAATQLRNLCAFLGLEASADYLRSATGIVFPTPHRSRTECDWPAALVDSIHARNARTPFLSHYRIDS